MPLNQSKYDCDGDCGAYVEVNLHERGKFVDAAVIDVMQALGWTTRTHGKRTEFYCQFCQKRARRIVEGS